MKIAKITGVNINPLINERKKSENNVSNPITGEQTITAYRDFNVNFRGRTPEDFYAQDYNVRNMPTRMKNYLAVNYEERKHIPPQQVMGEVFKDITIADNVEDVKILYPEEVYFQNLHLPTKKFRKGIFDEIKDAKEVENLPLLKDGKDDLGVYLLTKIYKEGKTLREINKDFFEQDMNPAYIGVISSPIDYTTTSAYGIRYPKNDFWHSFIATREEYKKFFLENVPKDDTQKQPSTAAGSGTHHSNPIKPVEVEEKKEKAPSRKYKIKEHQKKHLKDEIKSAKGDKNEIEKAVIKRFKKDDPEASFIVKYLSPIMTIAANRIHLSEEEKAFAEMEKEKGKVSEEKYMLSRFWKSNPELLEFYSTAIVDTMEMFTERYSVGGLIPINKDYQAITDNIENKKAIDYVSQDFLDLLNHAQTIVPERNAKYLAHDEAQEQWNKHFLERYGEVKAQEEVKRVEMKNPEAVLNDIAESEGAEVIKLKGKDGSDVLITGNIDEGFAENILKNEMSFYPKSFARLYVRALLNDPLCTRDYKLGKLMVNHMDKVAEGEVISLEEVKDINAKLINNFHEKYEIEPFAADFALIEVLAKKNLAGPLYRYFLGGRGRVEEKALDAALYEGVDPSLTKELNALYEKYKKPLSISEMQNAAHILMNHIVNYDSNKTKENTSVLRALEGAQAFAEVMRDMCNESKEKRKHIKSILTLFLKRIPTAQCLLTDTQISDPVLASNLKKSKPEAILLKIISTMYDKKVSTKLMQFEEKKAFLELLTRVRGLV